MRAQSVVQLPLTFDTEHARLTIVRREGGSRVMGVTRLLPGEWEVIRITAVLIDDRRAAWLIERVNEID